MTRRHAGLLLAALALTGCGGPKLGEVRGKVIVDGKPLESGTMSFIPLKGDTQTAGCAIKDGHYSAQVPLALMRVQISAPIVVGEQALYADNPNSKKIQRKEESLPAEYNSASTLEIDVKPGVNEKDYDLKSK